MGARCLFLLVGQAIAIHITIGIVDGIVLIIIGHAVIVGVGVPHIEAIGLLQGIVQAIAIQVTIRIAEPEMVLRIAEAIAARVPQQRVGARRLHLVTVGQTITIRVGRQGIGACVGFPPVGQEITIVVTRVRTIWFKDSFVAISIELPFPDWLAVTIRNVTSTDMMHRMQHQGKQGGQLQASRPRAAEAAQHGLTR